MNVTLVTSSTVTSWAPGHDVWALWVDVRGWPAWDDSIRSVEFDGRFAPGAELKVQENDGDPLLTRLMSVSQGEEFTTCTDLRSGIIRTARHRLSASGPLATVTHEIEVVVPESAMRDYLTGPWVRIQRDLPNRLWEMVDLASPV